MSFAQELPIYEKEITESLLQAEEEIKKIEKNASAKVEIIKKIELLIARATRVFGLFEIGVRGFVGAKTGLYKEKVKEFKKRLAQCNADFNWFKVDRSSNETREMSRITNAKDIRELSPQEARNYGSDLQDKSIESLNRSLASIAESTKIAQEVAVKSKSQTEQLHRIQNETSTIDSTLSGALKKIKKMISRN